MIPKRWCAKSVHVSHTLRTIELTHHVAGLVTVAPPVGPPPIAAITALGTT